MTTRASSSSPTPRRSGRPRGRTTWRPYTKSRALLDQVRQIIDEYREHLPMTIRQIFYRLVGAYDYPKTAKAYSNLIELLIDARRTTVPEFHIPFEVIRDDGGVAYLPSFHTSPADVWRSIMSSADHYCLDRQAGQPAYREVWVEAAGMVPQIARVVQDEFSIPVYSSGGFDSLTAKRDAARRAAAREVPTEVLYIGDYDPSGRAMLDNLAADVPLLERGAERMTFLRVAVTPEQIEAHRLPAAYASNTHGSGTSVQAEALPPDVLAAEVRQAVISLVDADALAEVARREAADRDAIRERLRRLEPPDTG